MKLGEKIRAARVSAGLTQRQLAGEKITRNMLSLIENGSAVPSVETLRFLAERLNKPVSFFLEESKEDCMQRAWDLFDAGNPEDALQLLQQVQEPDKGTLLLKVLCLLTAAESSVRQGKTVYAHKLLAQAEESENAFPWLPELKTRRLRILAMMRESVDIQKLPEIDRELYLYAYACMRSDAPERAAAYLEACSDKTASDWRILRARTHMAKGEYKQASELLREEEQGNAQEAVPLLEQCYRELGDYQKAYYYACLQRK